MKKVVFIILCTLLFANSIFAERRIVEFWNLMGEKKYDEVETLLDNWEQENKKDAELYVAYFNFYSQKATQNQMYFEKELPPDCKSYMKVRTKTAKKVICAL